jgi:hypothetical protein
MELHREGPSMTVEELAKATLKSMDERGWIAGAGHRDEGPLCVAQHAGRVLRDAGVSPQECYTLHKDLGLRLTGGEMLAAWNDRSTEEEVRAALQALIA